MASSIGYRLSDGSILCLNLNSMKPLPISKKNNSCSPSNCQCQNKNSFKTQEDLDLLKISAKPNYFFKNLSSVMIGFGIAFFPKCPLCWAAYMTLFSALGLETIPYQPWMLPAMIALLFVNIAVLFFRSKKNNRFGPVLFSLAGAFLILIAKFWLNSDFLVYTGLVLVLTGSAWNALSDRMKQYFLNFFPIKINQFSAINHK